MNSTNHESNHQVFTADPPISVLKNLKVRTLEPQEYQRAGELLDREHYLGDVPQGRQLLQVVEYNGQWVALLDWGPATLKLSDREEWIGWTSQQRAERLGLVVLNRRFLVLGKTRMPNLATKSLALATKALPADPDGLAVVVHAQLVQMLAGPLRHGAPVRAEHFYVRHADDCAIGLP